MLHDAEWATLLEGTCFLADREDQLQECGLDEPCEGKIVCIPMFIRLRRAGSFKIGVTLSVTLYDVTQRLVAASTVECQRSLELSSSVLSVPEARGDGSGGARCIILKNISKLCLQLTDAQVAGVEKAQGCSPDVSGIVYSTCQFGASR